MRNVSCIQSVSDIKGLHSSGLRSISKSMRSSSLELYVLEREVDRLQKEKAALDKRRNRVQGRLDHLTLRMKELFDEQKQKCGVDIKEGKPFKEVSKKGKSFTKMALKY
ncbi:MAG: hypothetical protein KKF54_00455 [Candidatus Omnitrophica bacterium]|nr:hypothetical protein [Candidatus Omnitrophota bacterium]